MYVNPNDGSLCAPSMYISCGWLVIEMVSRNCSNGNSNHFTLCLYPRSLESRQHTSNKLWGSSNNRKNKRRLKKEDRNKRCILVGSPGALYCKIIKALPNILPHLHYNKTFPLTSPL